MEYSTPLYDLIYMYVNYSLITKTRATASFEMSMAKYMEECLKSLNLIKLSDLSTSSWLDIIGWFKKNKTTLKNTSINKVLKFLMRVFNYHDVLSPLGRLKTLKNDVKSFDTPTKEDIQKLFSYVLSIDNSGNNLLYKLIIVLLRETGCRVNELLNLKFSNISYNPNVITLEITKSGKKRITSFSDSLATPLLKLAYKKHGKKSDYVLFNYLRNSKCLVDTIKYAVTKVSRGAKVRKMHAHMFRKYFATDMYQKLNGDVFTVQRLLGHSSPEQTQIYVSNSVDHLISQYNKVIK